MNLGNLFLLTDESIRYEQDGVEVLIIPGMLTFRARGNGFRCDASLSEVAFYVGEKAVFTYQGKDAGFTFSCPDEVARKVIEKRNQVMSETNHFTG